MEGGLFLLRQLGPLFALDLVHEGTLGIGIKQNGEINAKLGVFRAGGTSAEIKFAIGQCSLGSILVAASNKGVCAILLGEDPDALVRDLQDRFPLAQMIGGDQEFERLVAHVGRLCRGAQDRV
jgi:hypothetical protein